jgi:hypothetical protein
MELELKPIWIRELHPYMGWAEAAKQAKLLKPRRGSAFRHHYVTEESLAQLRTIVATRKVLQKFPDVRALI